MLGKQVRLRRLFNEDSGRILVIAMDHPIGWGVLPGIDAIKRTMEKIVAAQPDAITMMKGTAVKVFAPYAGTLPFIMKATSFSPYQPAYDTAVASVEEAVRLGADAIAVGATLCGKDQAELLAQLGRFAQEADSVGMPTVTHIYPKGEDIKPEDRYKEEYVKYCARAAAELNIDIVKTFYTGDPESYARVIEATPVPVVVSGGPKLPSLRDVFKMTYHAISAGAKGITYGRNVWQADNPAKVIAALKMIIHHGASVDEAMKLSKEK